MESTPASFPSPPPTPLSSLEPEPHFQPLQLHDESPDGPSSSVPLYIDIHSPAQSEQVIDPPEDSRRHRGLKLIILFFTAAGAVVQFLQIEQDQDRHLPITFYLAALFLLISFALTFVSLYISPIPGQKITTGLMDQLSSFFGFTSIFLAITTYAPLWLFIISWSLYALCLLIFFHIFVIKLRS